MINRRIVALHGNSRSGKDAIGEFLVGQGAVRFAKGDILKTVAYEINPLIAIPDTDVWNEAHGSFRLANLVDALGWERSKDLYPDSRRFLQEMADRVVDAIGRDVWNEAVYAKIDASDHEFIVLTRVCLPIECEPLHQRGGELWTVRRPGCEPALDPTTGKPNGNETALDDGPFDRIINNDGTLEGLRAKVDFLAMHYGEELAPAEA